MVIYIFIAHILAWFVLGAFVALFRDRGTAITISSAAVLGICSAALHLTLKQIGYL